jgi:hypothetical protein
MPQGKQEKKNVVCDTPKNKADEEETRRKRGKG